MSMKSYVRWIPGAARLYGAYRSVSRISTLIRSPFLEYVPPGHHYSSIPDIDDVLANADNLFRRDSRECAGVDLLESAQLALLEDFGRYYADLHFPTSRRDEARYYYENPYFVYGDAVILYCMMRHYRPRRVLEIGSGFSSAAMLDVSDRFLDDTVRFTFIDPNPARLLGILRPTDRQHSTVVTERVQDVPMELFRGLAHDDILFVDSSHVVKIGSDVGHILFNVLPVLSPGVVVHFHDIFWPFEYPKEWILEGRSYNEAYFLRAFLQFNGAFEILYFNSFMAEFHARLIEARMPLCLKDPGSSLWMRKIA